MSKHAFAIRADTLWPPHAGVWFDVADGVLDTASWIQIDRPSAILSIPGDSGSGQVARVPFRPVRIGDRWFADVVVEGVDDPMFDGHKAHLIARLDFVEDTLRLGVMWDSDLQDFDEVNPGWIHLVDIGKSVTSPEYVLTSDTKELRRFFGRFGGVDSLFSASKDFVLHR